MFNPHHPIIQLCVRARIAQEQENFEQASQLLKQALESNLDDYHAFIVAYQFANLAKLQKEIFEEIKWLNEAVQYAKKVEDIGVKSAYPTIYQELSQAYITLGNQDYADRYRKKAQQAINCLQDDGPFYHGTKAELAVGDLLVAGKQSNYQDDLVMNHIYFTANLNGASLAASLAHGQGSEHVYLVQPTGAFEADPNVTNQKFPGNLTRSYRSNAPLKVLAEVTDYQELSDKQKQTWQKRIEKAQGEIIN